VWRTHKCLASWTHRQSGHMAFACVSTTGNTILRRVLVLVRVRVRCVCVCVCGCVCVCVCILGRTHGGVACVPTTLHVLVSVYCTCLQGGNSSSVKNTIFVLVYASGTHGGIACVSITPHVLVFVYCTCLTGDTHEYMYSWVCHVFMSVSCIHECVMYS